MIGLLPNTINNRNMEFLHLLTRWLQEVDPSILGHGNSLFISLDIFIIREIKKGKGTHLDGAKTRSSEVNTDRMGVTVHVEKRMIVTYVMNESICNGAWRIKQPMRQSMG